MTLTDLVGNAATGLAGAPFSLDVHPPVIGSVHVVADRYSAVVALRRGRGGARGLGVPGRCRGAAAGDPRRRADGVQRLGRARLHLPLPGDRAGARGDAPIAVRATDAAGNEGFASSSTLLDFTPPAVGSAIVSYLPGPGNPLALVSRATVGTEIVIVALADEELSATDAPTLKLGCGAQEIASGLAAASRTSNSATFRVRVPAMAYDGDCVPQVDWSDRVGNRNAAAGFGAPTGAGEDLDAGAGGGPGGGALRALALGQRGGGGPGRPHHSRRPVLRAGAGGAAGEPGGAAGGHLRAGRGSAGAGAGLGGRAAGLPARVGGGQRRRELAAAAAGQPRRADCVRERRGRRGQPLGRW